MTTTSVRCHPSAFAAGATDAEIDARVLTILTLTVVVAWLPARSTAVPVKVCDPSAVTTIGGAHDAMPEPASAHVKVIVASASMTPLAPGAGVTAAAIVGAAVSMFTVNELTAVLPATSVALPVTCCAAPCADTVTGG